MQEVVKEGNYQERGEKKTLHNNTQTQQRNNCPKYLRVQAVSSWRISPAPDTSSCLYYLSFCVVLGSLCTPSTGGLSLTWELGSNTISQAAPQTYSLKPLDAGLSNLWFYQPSRWCWCLSLRSFILINYTLFPQSETDVHPIKQKFLPFPVRHVGEEASYPCLWALLESHTKHQLTTAWISEQQHTSDMEEGMKKHGAGEEWESPNGEVNQHLFCSAKKTLLWLFAD